MSKKAPAPLTTEDRLQVDDLVRRYERARKTQGRKLGFLYRDKINGFELRIAANRPSKLEPNEIALKLDRFESSSKSETNKDVFYNRFSKESAHITRQLGINPGEYLHRFIMQASGTDIIDGHQVHHINLNSLDNRRENLTAVSPKIHRELHKRLDRLKVDSKKKLFDSTKNDYLIIKFIQATTLPKPLPDLSAGLTYYPSLNVVYTRPELTPAELVDLGVSAARASLCAQILALTKKSRFGSRSISFYCENIAPHSAKRTLQRALKDLIRADLLQCTVSGWYKIPTQS